MLQHVRSQVARAVSSHQPAAGRDTTLADRGSLRSQRAVLYRFDRLMTAHCSRILFRRHSRGGSSEPLLDDTMFAIDRIGLNTRTSCHRDSPDGHSARVAITAHAWCSTPPPICALPV